MKVGRSRFLTNTASLAVSMSVGTVLTLAQVKILSASLSMEVFGAFASMRGLSLFVSILAANGLPQLLIRYLPSHEAEARRRAALRLSIVCILITAILLAAGVLVLYRMPSLFSGLPEAVRSSAFIFWFAATTVGVALKMLVYAGLNGLRRSNAQMVLEIGSMIAQVLWIYLVRDHLTMEVLFRILGFVSLATMVVGLPWYFIYLVRSVQPDNARTTHGQTSDNYPRYWLGAAGLSVVALAFSDADRYLLSGVLAMEFLAVFHIAARVARMANRVLSVPILAFQPEVTRLDAENRADDVQKSTRVFLKFNVLVSVLIAGLVVSYSPEIIRIVSNSQYLSARWLLALLVISVPMTAMTAPLTTVMKARDSIGRALVCDAAWAVTYVAALLILGSLYGVIGAGAAQFLACFVQLLCAIWLGRIGMSMGIFLMPLARAIASALVAFVPAVLLSNFWPLEGMAHVGAKFVLIVPALWLYRKVSVLLKTFEDEEAELLIRMFDARGLGGIARRVLS